MSQIYILCVDDELADLENVHRDLAEFESSFPIKVAKSAEQARETIKSLMRNDDKIGLILCSHFLPGENGIDLMISMHNDLGMTETRKILITRRAGLEETVKGLNEGKLNYYLAKPWIKEEIILVVREQLTDYFIRSRQNPMSCIENLNQVRIFDAMHKGIIPREE